jgi:acyl-CoA oxidase
MANQKGSSNDPLDFLALTELLPPELNRRRLEIRSALETFVRPVIDNYVEKAEFPFELVSKLQELRLFGLDEEGFGCKRVCPLEKAMILYELARIDAGLSTFYVVQGGLALRSIELLGNNQQKSKYLKDIADLKLISCFALTEPNRGSDASGLETTATPVKGGYLITGEKRWIGNASFSGVMVVYARNTVSKDVEAFVVDSKAQGVSVSVIQRKLALRIVQNGHITFKAVFVAEEEKLEKAKNFATGPNVVLNSSRIMVPWVALGMMGGSFEVACKYLKERKQFGAPIGSYQLMQEKLVRILGYFNASFLQSWKLLTLPKCDASQSALVKSQVSAMGRECTKLARELLGGNGIVIDGYAMKAMLDMEAIYTYEGTYDINALVTGRALVGIPAFKASFKL